MASIVKRGNSWRVFVRIKGYPTQSKTFKTKALCEEWARLAESNPLDMLEPTVTFKHCLERYGKEITPFKKSRVSELLRLKQLARLGVSSLAVDEIKPEHIAALRDYRLKQGKAPATVVFELTLISHVFTIAVKDWGMMLDNPVLKVRKPKVNNARNRRLEGDELSRILSCCDDELKAWVIVAIETAMRRGEQIQMNSGDFRGNSFTLHDSKNGQGRVVPLSTKAVAAITELRTSQSVTHHTKSGSKSLWGHKADYYSNAFKAACKAAGVEGLRLHDLRREGVSRLFEKGLNMFEVKAVSGHKTTQMLERYVTVHNAAFMDKLG